MHTVGGWWGGNTNSWVMMTPNSIWFFMPSDLQEGILIFDKKKNSFIIMIKQKALEKHSSPHDYILASGEVAYFLFYFGKRIQRIIPVLKTLFHSITWDYNILSYLRGKFYWKCFFFNQYLCVAHKFSPMLLVFYSIFHLLCDFYMLLMVSTRPLTLGKENYSFWKIKKHKLSTTRNFI